MGDETVYEAIAGRIAVQRRNVEGERDALDRADPRGRHLSLAITALEDAELRLAHAAGIEVPS